jgi:hypothetical protein
MENYKIHKDANINSLIKIMTLRTEKKKDEMMKMIKEERLLQHN